MRTVTPFLMLDDQLDAAVELYTRPFPVDLDVAALEKAHAEA